MNAIKFLKVWSEICESDSHKKCEDCPLMQGAGCMANALLHPETMVELVEEFSDPRPTILEDFMKKNPKADEIDVKWTICPHWVGYEENHRCVNDCEECWNRKVKVEEEE